MVNIKHKIYLIIGMCLLYVLIYALLQKPSNNRDWADDQKILPYAEINKNLITIHNIRNFEYKTEFEYTKNYYDKEFNLDEIKNLYFIVEPFNDFKGAAHTFFSFEFENDNFVAISVEIRKEENEKFSAIKGLFNQYEIMYVIADEKDVVKLRANFRKDKVYVLPMKITKEKMQELFIDMIKRTNELKNKPEFYNSLFNNCTTNLMKHVNTISPKRIPFSYKIILPAYSGEFAFDLGLIKTDLTSYEEVKNKFLINEKAEMFADDEGFERGIRG